MGWTVQAQSRTESPLHTAQASTKKVDASTLTGKVMCGYQGWFAVPTDAINRGWYHYKLNNTFAPGSCKFDLWPDLFEMDSDEKYAAPGFVTATGAQAYLFSSQNRKTVVRHFKWMSDYGIDGVFMQRFATEVFNGGAGQTQFNNVLASCREGAHQYGRVFAVMYDLSGMKAGEWKKVLTDWRTQIVQKSILQDSCYLFHNGKPVVAVWGIGFNDGRAYTLSECDALIDSLRNHPLYGGNTVMVGVPTHWRTLDQDAVSDSALHRIILKADIVSPWFVGRPNSLDGIVAHTQTVVIPDVQWCTQYIKDYLPVAFPGFSWHNMKPTYPLNQIPRLGGQFLWKQYFEYIQAGTTMIYQAMFDEIDEATAIFKCTNDPPVGASTFVTYEGLPSDHYLWLVGQGGRMLRHETAVTETLPERPSTGVQDRKLDRPREFILNQNFPNPFNPSTTIGYMVPCDSFVELTVYSIIGKKVVTLVEEHQSGGFHQTDWDGQDEAGFNVSGGVYFCRLSLGGFQDVRKIMLLR
jgi:hypothetical protein